MYGAIWPIYSQVSLWCSFSRCCLFGHWERIWKSWAPAKCRFFLWFVAHNQCWTTDGLAQQGLNHPKHEAIQHVLVSSFWPAKSGFTYWEWASPSFLLNQGRIHLMTGGAELLQLCLPKEKSCFSCEWPHPARFKLPNHLGCMDSLETQGWLCF